MWKGNEKELGKHQRGRGLGLEGILERFYSASLGVAGTSSVGLKWVGKRN